MPARDQWTAWHSATLEEHTGSVYCLSHEDTEWTWRKPNICETHFELIFNLCFQANIKRKICQYLHKNSHISIYWAQQETQITSKPRQKVKSKSIRLWLRLEKSYSRHSVMCKKPWSGEWRKSWNCLQQTAADVPLRHISVASRTKTDSLLSTGPHH